MIETLLAVLLGGDPIVVSPGGTVPTLTAALARAVPGDYIVVRPGVYREPTIVVAKRVTIEGVGGPVFDGGGQTVLLVTSDSVTIRGLVIRNVSPSNVEERAGIKLDHVRGCVIEANEVLDTFFGIYGAAVRDCRVARNRVVGPARTEGQSGNAIHFWSSERITVEGNEVRGHRDGIYLEFVKSSRLSDNTSQGNRRYGMHFMFSDSCSYLRNSFLENGAGVAVMYTRRVTMTENRFEQNQGAAAYGLLLKDITDSRIEGNRFASNTVGLHLEASNRLQVEGNRFVGNGWAVRVLANATDNSFTRNTFEGNAFDVTTNSRTTSSTFRENYWDHYRGFDLDRDGYGDVPYRPVRLFSLVVEQDESALILLRSLFVDLLDAAERMLPILTPETLADGRPLMERPRW